MKKSELRSLIKEEVINHKLNNMIDDYLTEDRAVWNSMFPQFLVSFITAALSGVSAIVLKDVGASASWILVSGIVGMVSWATAGLTLLVDFDIKDFLFKIKDTLVGVRVKYSPSYLQKINNDANKFKKKILTDPALKKYRGIITKYQNTIQKHIESGDLNNAGYAVVDLYNKMKEVSKKS